MEGDIDTSLLLSKQLFSSSRDSIITLFHLRYSDTLAEHSSGAKRGSSEARIESSLWNRWKSTMSEKLEFFRGFFFYLPHSNFQSCIIALDSYFITTSWKALLFLLSIIMWRAERRCGNDRRRHHTTAHENCSRHLLSMFINKLSVCFQLIRLLGKQVLYGWYGWRQFKKKKCMQKKNT